MGSSLVNSPYPVYLALYARALGFTTVQWTLLNTGMILLVSLSLLGLPRLMRHVGARSIMTGSFLFTGACFAAIATRTVAGVTVGALAFGVSATASSLCVITELQKGSTRVGRLNSASTVINGACSVVAPLLAALLVRGPGYGSLWLGSMAVSFLQAAACRLLPGHVREGASAPRASASPAAPVALPAPGPFALLFRSGFAPLLFGMSLLEPFSYQVLNLYSALRLSALGLSDATIGVVTSGAFALYLASSVAAFFVLDRLNVRVLLAACLACAALSSVGFGLAAAAAPAVVALCCYQFFYGWLHPSKNTRLSRFATNETRAAFFSYGTSVQSFTSAALNAAASALVGSLGMQPLIAGGAFLAAGGGLATLAAPAHMRPVQGRQPRAAASGST
jgi:hypothetical protein